VGIAVYVGNETKIMKNAKKAPKKVSNIMRTMNHMLYTVFAFQALLILLFSGLNVMWVA
jgi:magnesium-transporting ATPase (P-type)